MIIHLLRHADAEDTVTTDAARRLSGKGRKQAARVGEFLKKITPPLDLILSSPYIRASQTAQAVHARNKHAQYLEDRRLGCGMSPAVAMEILQEYASFETVLLVGHQPDLSALASYLLSPDRSLLVDFRKASLLSLEMNPLRAGRAVLQSFVNVQQMG